MRDYQGSNPERWQTVLCELRLRQTLWRWEIGPGPPRLPPSSLERTPAPINNYETASSLPLCHPNFSARPTALPRGITPQHFKCDGPKAAMHPPQIVASKGNVPHEPPRTAIAASKSHGLGKPELRSTLNFIRLSSVHSETVYFAEAGVARPSAMLIYSNVNCASRNPRALASTK